MSDTQPRERLADVLGVDLGAAESFLEKTAQDAFIETLAGFGYQIKTAEELKDFMDLAELVNNAAAADNSQQSLVKSASDHLRNALGQGNTVASREAMAAADSELAKSAQVALDPDVAKHLLALYDAQAGGE